LKPLSVVLSGDPKRKPLFNQIKKYYQRYPFIDRVFLLFNKNPAISFNQGTKLSKTNTILYTADVYIPYETINKLQMHAADNKILFLTAPTEKRTIQFCSGAFITTKKTMIKSPMPETPDFMEEILYQQNKKLTFKPYQTTYIHAHKHTLNHIIKFRVERYLLRARIKKTKSPKKLAGLIKLTFESIMIYLEERIVLAKFREL
jgi:hypothetical protein